MQGLSGAVERRAAGMRSIVYGVVFGRRRQDRSNQGAGGQYIDSHHPWLLISSVGILLFCCADACFTLYLLQRGAVEINPFMAWLIELDAGLFFVVKLFLTALGTTLLVLLWNRRLFGVLSSAHILHSCLSMYALLITYEFYGIMIS